MQPRLLKRACRKIELIAKDLLDSKGEVSRCQDNMPGDDWFAGFMKRNKMSARFASNIKRPRSKVDAEDITSFFNELFGIIRNFSRRYHFRL